MGKIPITADNITPEEMDKAIRESGYLLEQRIASQFRKSSYKVLKNKRYVDRETSKSLEYDVCAYKDIPVCESESYGVFPTFICECKNYSQPVIFLIEENSTFEPLEDEIFVSGIPSKIWHGGKWLPIQQTIQLERFHHYCKPEAPVVSIGFTFERKNESSPWKANYTEDQYSTFNRLVKALEYEIEEDYKNMGQWCLPGENKTDIIDLSFYYPLLIYQGDIFTFNENNNPHLEQRKHVQFNSEFFSVTKNEIISFQIDVITESHLLSYLQIIEQEMIEIKKALLQRKREVLLSPNKLARQCRNLKIKPETYRRLLEFEF